MTPLLPRTAMSAMISANDDIFVEHVCFSDLGATLLPHSFLVSHGCGCVPIIVDWQLHDLVDVARPSKEHTRLIRKLPRLFVGTLGQLLDLLHAPCQSAVHSLHAEKMYVAPWRHYRVIASAFCRCVGLSTQRHELATNGRDSAL